MGRPLKSAMRKNLGDKGNEISEKQRQDLFEIYLKNQENEFCKIYDNHFFGYTKVIIEQPLIEEGKVVCDRQGKPKPNPAKRDYERVPLCEDINEYFEREVKPYLPEAWMARSKDKVGYEINFTKYFYQFKPLRSLDDITQDLLKLDEEMEGLTKETLQR